MRSVVYLTIARVHACDGKLPPFLKLTNTDRAQRDIRAGIHDVEAPDSCRTPRRPRQRPRVPRRGNVRIYLGYLLGRVLHKHFTITSMIKLCSTFL